LLDLPKGLLDNIVKYSSSPHELDLDSFTDMKDFYGILYANMWLHDQYINTVLLDNTFALSLMTSDALASFDFDKLD
jgi:hypothetical protein